jgi:serine/threonine protein kinase
VSLITGSRLGPYEVVALIGAGGMGEVYRARDLKLNRDVALKVLPISRLDDPRLRARLEGEAHTLAALNNPHIATIHDIIEVGDHRAIVMELVAGSTLAEVIVRGPVPLRTALGYGINLVARRHPDLLHASGRWESRVGECGRGRAAARPTGRSGRHG